MDGFNKWHQPFRAVCMPISATKSAITGPIILSYSNEKILFQSFFMLITVQFFFFASS
jgi:hypothetical protein